jgi:hypothetical protein
MSISIDLANFILQLILVQNLNHIQKWTRRLFNFFQKKIFCKPLFLSEILDFFFKLKSYFEFLQRLAHSSARKRADLEGCQFSAKKIFFHQKLILLSIYESN